MSFRTKINLQDNRQHHLPTRESQDFSGTTVFGIPFSAMTSGPDPINSGTTGSILNIVSTFSGNTGTTIFNFGDSRMNIAQGVFSALTSTNSATTQNSGNIFVGNTSQIIDGNSSYLDYTGTSFDFEVTSINEISPGLFTGSGVSDDVFFLTANTLDFTGRTIWNDTVGISRTKKLIVSDGATAGYVLTSDSEGMGTWQPSGGNGGLNTFITGSSVDCDTFNISLFNNDNSSINTDISCLFSGITGDTFWLAGDGVGSFKSAYGDGLLVNGTHSFVSGGDNLVISGSNRSLIIGGESNSITRNGNGGSTDLSIIGGESNSIDSKSGFQFRNNITGGISNSMEGRVTNSSIIGGQNNKITNGNNVVILGGRNITGTTSDMVYVPDLVIDGLISTDPIATDANGKIVAGASDRRLKEKINNLNGALDKIKSLRGVSYEWTKESKMGEGVTKYGLIAQEVQEVIPDMVRLRSKGDGMLTLSYTEIVPWLIEAIKELSNTGVKTNNTVLNTQTIASEDNNIELNYNGNHDTALNGGLTLLHGVSDGVHSEIKIDENGRWDISSITTDEISLPEYTPTSSRDTYGKVGDTVWGDKYLYIKTNFGWRRSRLKIF